MVKIVSETRRQVTLEVDAKLTSILEKLRLYQMRHDVNKLKTPSRYMTRWKNESIIYIDKNAIAEPYSTIGDGKRIFSVGSFSSVMSSFEQGSRFGRYCSIAKSVTMGGFRHPIDAVSSSNAVFKPSREFMYAYTKDKARENNGERPFIFKSVPIPQKKPGVDVGHDVWIGSGVSINRGIKIGDGAVVAANSVVTKDVAPYSIVGGNPAKHIKFRFEQEICEGLQRIRWWEFELSDLHELPMSDPDKFIEQFEKNKNNIRPYKPLKSKFWDLIKQHSDRS